MPSLLTHSGSGCSTAPSPADPSGSAGTNAEGPNPPSYSHSQPPMSLASSHTRRDSTALITPTEAARLGTSKRTDAFHDLTAWFSKAVHPTAIYAWSECARHLHIRLSSLSFLPLYDEVWTDIPAAHNKGKLASLSGVESGDQLVDVIFSRPGDPFLQR